MTENEATNIAYIALLIANLALFLLNLVRSNILDRRSGALDERSTIADEREKIADKTTVLHASGKRITTVRDLRILVHHVTGEWPCEIDIDTKHGWVTMYMPHKPSTRDIFRIRDLVSSDFVLQFKVTT